MSTTIDYKTRAEKAQGILGKDGIQLPQIIKAQGHRWYLQTSPKPTTGGKRGVWYECPTAPAEWEGSQVELIGRKSIKPYWAMSEEGRASAIQVGRELNRLRVIASQS